MQYRVREETIRRIGVVEVECYKYRTQMQRMSVIEEGKGGEEKSRRESSMYSNATKGTAKRKAGMSY